MASPLCPGCLKIVSGNLAHPGCFRQWTPNFLFAPFRYRGVVRQAIKTAKFHHDPRLIKVLARLLIEEVEETAKLYRFLATESPLVIPVPLGRQRLMKRGFNQTSILGLALAQYWQLDCNEKVLTRRSETLPQTLCSGPERTTNLLGAFVARKSYLRGCQKVILVDDVVTTGATLKASTLALRKVGVREVWAVVLAH